MKILTRRNEAIIDGVIALFLVALGTWCMVQARDHHFPAEAISWYLVPYCMLMACLFAFSAGCDMMMHVHERDDEAGGRPEV